MLKRKPVQGPLYSFFGGKQSSDDKEINTASETPALTKKTCKFPWKENTNDWALKEGETKCSASFVENSRKGKTCNTPEDRIKLFLNRQPESTYMYHGASEGHALTNVQENGISF